MTTGKAVLIFIVAIVAFGLWIFRWDVRPGTSANSVIVADRWTGEVQICNAGACVTVHPQ